MHAHEKCWVFLFPRLTAAIALTDAEHLSGPRSKSRRAGGQGGEAGRGERVDHVSFSPHFQTVHTKIQISFSPPAPTEGEGKK